MPVPSRVLDIRRDGRTGVTIDRSIGQQDGQGGAAVQVRDHEIFQYDGYRLAATSYEPDGAARAVIVFCHGWGGTKGILAPQIAEGFVALGDFAVVTFDFSGFGLSDGPRNRLDPVRQQRDCRAVLAYGLSEWPDVRAAGIFGLSFGGAIATMTAASDRRIRALVTVGGFADGEQWLQDLRPYWQFVEMTRAVEDDAAAMTRTGASKVVDPDWIFPRDPDAAAFNKKLMEEFPERRFDLDVASAGLIAELKPIRVAPYMNHCNALFVQGERDVTAPVTHAVRLAEAAGGSLEIVKGVGHYDMYAPGNFERMVAIAGGWFVRYLLDV
jgi:pimeloyl-ACP methyl ester carboxylesterase